MSVIQTGSIPPSAFTKRSRWNRTATLDVLAFGNPCSKERSIQKHHGNACSRPRVRKCAGKGDRRPTLSQRQSAKDKSRKSPKRQSLVSKKSDDLHNNHPRGGRALIIPVTRSPPHQVTNNSPQKSTLLHRVRTITAKTSPWYRRLPLQKSRRARKKRRKFNSRRNLLETPARWLRSHIGHSCLGRLRLPACSAPTASSYGPSNLTSACQLRGGTWDEVLLDETRTEFAIPWDLKARKASSVLEEGSDRRFVRYYVVINWLGFPSLKDRELWDSQRRTGPGEPEESFRRKLVWPPLAAGFVFLGRGFFTPGE